MKTRMLLTVLAGSCALAGCASQDPEPLGRVVLPSIELEPLPRARLWEPSEQMPAVPRPWRAENPRPWKYVVIHHSATEHGNAKLFDKAHRRRGWDELGYHFVITNGNGGDDGAIEVGSRWTKQKHGAHTGGTPENAYNELGIGVCLVGNFTRAAPSRAQLDALDRLVSYLRHRFDIPAENVIPHNRAPNAATQCPGAALHRYVVTALRKKTDRRIARASDEP